MNNNVAISIITPCYNHGKYLQEVVESIKNYQWKVGIEHIIIDDGSKDAYTLNKLKELEKDGIKVIYQENSGPGKARNEGIKIAKGTYILPLDSDNAIFPSVFEKAYHYMEDHQEIDVTYTDAEYFGNYQGKWIVGELNKKNIFFENQIDTCSLIRASVLREIGGYDEDRQILSNEDWELWLRFIVNEKQFYYLNEIGFKYRIVEESLSKKIAQKEQLRLLNYLFIKFNNNYFESYVEIFSEMKALNKKNEIIENYLKTKKMKSIIKILSNQSIVNDKYI